MAILISTQVTDRLATMLTAVTAGNGYSSDVGQQVYVGQLHGLAEDAPAVWLTPGREQAVGSYGGTHVTRTMSITGFVRPEAHPSQTEHALVDLIIWDIRRRVETYDSTLAALAEVRFSQSQPGYRDRGSQLVGAAVTYDVTYSVDWTDPTTAI